MIKSDKWIRRMAESTGMIEPFEAGQIRRGRRKADRVVRHVELWLRYPLLARVQDLHQHQLDDRRPEELRRRLVRRLHGRRVHHPAEFVRAREDGGVLPHSAERAHDLSWEMRDRGHARVERRHRSARVDRRRQCRGSRRLASTAGPTRRERNRVHAARSQASVRASHACRHAHQGHGESSVPCATTAGLRSRMLRVGARIAVPRALPVFGTSSLPAGRRPCWGS